MGEGGGLKIFQTWDHLRAVGVTTDGVVWFGWWCVWPDSSRWFKTRQRSSFLKSSLVAVTITKPASFTINPLLTFPLPWPLIWPLSFVYYQVPGLSRYMQRQTAPLFLSQQHKPDSLTHSKNILLTVVHIDCVVLYKFPVLSTYSFCREKCNDVTHTEVYFFPPKQPEPVALRSFIHLQNYNCPFGQIKMELFF